MKDVIIIGAGIAGLSSAHELNKENIDFQILEPANRVGGVIETIEIDGTKIETGPYTFSSYSKELMDIINDLKIQDELKEADHKSKKRFIYLNNKLVQIPTNPSEFFNSEILTKNAKWTLLEELVLPKGDKEESIENFFSRRFGREVLKNIIQPFLNGIYAGDVKKLSANAVFPKLKELEEKYKSVLLGSTFSQIGNIFKGRKPLTLYSFKDGMQTLPNSLYESFKNKVTLMARDIEIKRAKDFFIVSFKVNNKAINYTTNSILFAIPAYRMAEYGYVLPSESLPNFLNIEYVPIASVAQVVEKENLKMDLNGFGYLCTKEVQKKLLGTIWTSSIFPDTVEPGKALLSSFIGGAHFKKVSDLGYDDIASLTAREVSEILGISDPDQIKTLFIKIHEKAIPQYNMGHLDLVKKIEKLMDNDSGIFFTGNYLRGISLNDTVKTSMNTVKKIKRFLKNIVKEKEKTVAG